MGPNGVRLHTIFLKWHIPFFRTLQDAAGSFTLITIECAGVRWLGPGDFAWDEKSVSCRLQNGQSNPLKKGEL